MDVSTSADWSGSASLPSEFFRLAKPADNLKLCADHYAKSSRDTGGLGIDSTRHGRV